MWLTAISIIRKLQDQEQEYSYLDTHWGRECLKEKASSFASQLYRRNESRREEQVCRKSFLLVTLVQRQVVCNSLGKILSLGLHSSVFWECYLQLLRMGGW